MSKKLLWISQIVPYPPHAGVLLRAYHLLRAVAQEFDVDLVAFVQQEWMRTCFGNDVDAGLKASRAELSTFCKRVEFLDIPSEVSALGRYGLAAQSLIGNDGYTMLWLDSDAARKLLADLNATTRYDHVHCDTVSLADYRSIFPSATATLGHHNIESHMMERRAEQEENTLKRMFFAREAKLLLQAERRVASLFDAHVTCSELDNDRLLDVCGPLDVRAVPNGVDTAYFQASDSEPIENTLVFVGTMNWYPNVSAMTFFLDEVWPELSRRHPEITLGIVGSKPGAELISAAERDARIRVYGYVPDVRPYLAGAKLFVCPIRDGGGTKLKLLDAMSMSCGIVAHPIACEGIDLQDGLDVVLAESGESFVAAIDQLLAAPERIASMGQAARRLAVGKYSFEAIGHDFAESLKALIEHRQAAGR